MSLKHFIYSLCAVLLLTGCDGNTPLMKKVLHEDVEGTKTVLAQGVDINARNNYGWTALMHAARLGNSELTRILLEHGADINAQNEDGWTALMRAALKGDVATVKVLLDHGADVNIFADKSDTGALFWAAQRGHAEVVKVLLAAGADYTHVNSSGWTPMMAASYGGYNDIVQILRDAGARQ